jgi:hypothetical protein
LPAEKARERHLDVRERPSDPFADDLRRAGHVEILWSVDADDPLPTPAPITQHVGRLGADVACGDHRDLLRGMERTKERTRSGECANLIPGAGYADEVLHCHDRWLLLLF